MSFADNMAGAVLVSRRYVLNVVIGRLSDTSVCRAAYNPSVVRTIVICRAFDAQERQLDELPFLRIRYELGRTCPYLPTVGR